MKVYIIGSLRNEAVPKIAARLREHGYEVFDDWYAAGPEADDYWQKYETDRGHTYEEALRGYAAQHVFKFDKHHLDTSDAVVLALPAGKSGHLELGYAIGKGKRGFIMLDPAMPVARFDVMYAFAEAVVSDVEELDEKLKARTEAPIYVDNPLFHSIRPLTDRWPAGPTEDGVLLCAGEPTVGYVPDFIFHTGKRTARNDLYDWADATFVAPEDGMPSQVSPDRGGN
jgi:hypothetical protein